MSEKYLIRLGDTAQQLDINIDLLCTNLKVHAYFNAAALTIKREVVKNKGASQIQIIISLKSEWV